MKVRFSGAGYTKLAENVAAQLQRESRAPAGSDPEQLRDNAASSCASKLLCPGRAQQQVVRALRAVLRVPPSSNWGRGALSALVKKHLFEIYSSAVLEMPRANYSVSAKGEGKHSGVALAAPF